MTRATVAALLAAALSGACGDDEATRPSYAGSDVVQACSQRSTWSQSTSSACLTCLVTVQQAPCGCPAAGDLGGLCEREAQAVRDDQACSKGADACALACDRTDCGCLEACYASAASCRALAGARDGCVAATCDAACR